MHRFSLKTLALAFAAVAVPGLASAQLTANVSLTSNYKFRGQDQGSGKGWSPAVQGGFDWSQGGFYVGNWNSNIGFAGNIEMDLYGGYKGEIAKDFGYDVGVLQYYYHNNDLPTSANTTEVYGALTYGPATLKYSHSLSNLFGFANSKNSGYLDLSGTFDVGNGFSIVPHVGYQKVRNNDNFSYWDYSVTLNKDFGNGFSASAAVVGTDTNTYVGPNGKNLGRTGLVVGVKYTHSF